MKIAGGNWLRPPRLEDAMMDDGLPITPPIGVRSGGWLAHGPNPPLPRHTLVTASVMGDPPPGRSALDQRNGAER